MGKTIITVSGIRPDFIRFSEIVKKLDANFDRHILIHSGQHYDEMLSDVFFEELDIRQPDYNLGVGGPGVEHYRQTANMSIRIIEVLRKEHINPDIILFLGDSNSVCCAVPLKKEGYTIGHIEAGMRSYDRRMLEEINRVTCDHVSDFLFVYHEEYEAQAFCEGIAPDNVFVVGNTIVEPCSKIADSCGLFEYEKFRNKILVDIHRPENFKYQDRLENILYFVRQCSNHFGLPAFMLEFGRTFEAIKKFKLSTDGIRVVPLMSYKQFLIEQYHSAFIISDSGTAQEEPAMLDTPVIVPRDYTERPQSIKHDCSYMIDVNTCKDFNSAENWLLSKPQIDDSWLGDGNTSNHIVEILKDVL